MTSWHSIAGRVLRNVPSTLPGKTQVAKFFLRRSLHTEDVVLETGDTTRFMVPHLAEPIAFHLLIDGSYERETRSFILQRLTEGDAFVDVGANIGVFTVSAALKVGAQGRVLAIEASPRVFPYLERNVQLNTLDNVTVANCAASDGTEEDVSFYEAPANKFGMGSLAPQFSVKPTAVKTRTLDDLVREHGIERVAVLKVDVEGHEAGVFRGAERLLRGPHSPAIAFEFCDWAENRFGESHPGAAQAFLMSLGYKIWRLSDLAKGSARPLSEPLTSGSAMLAALRDVPGRLQR